LVGKGVASFGSGLYDMTDIDGNSVEGVVC
jgi:hypothetical protein